VNEQVLSSTKTERAIQKRLPVVVDIFFFFGKPLYYNECITHSKYNAATMVRKRLDDRLRNLLERSMVTRQRSMLVLVGDYGKDQIPNLHRILSQSSMQNPSVLWCYKKDLGFSTHQQKRMKKLKKQAQRGLLNDTEQAFDLFVKQAPITWCYYKDSHRVLGTTVKLLVLQDFEALTPNLMARTIETVSGGGLVVFLLKTVNSLKQLYQMSMDVHSRYRTESQADLQPRFNERFLLSLADNPACLVCDDELNVLPLSGKTLKQLSQKSYAKGDAGQVILEDTPEDEELRSLQESLADTPHIGVLVGQTKTMDQAQAVLQFLDACTEKQLRRTLAMTAARGRGKSAAMGLSLAGALALGYSTIAVTAPEPENLVAVFNFVIQGLNELKYQEHIDYNVVYNQASGRDEIKCVLSIQLHRTHRQMIQYVPPSAVDQFKSAEIIAIDEAAAIPLPIVKSLLQLKDERLVWLSSTINGYEGTGRALSLKLIHELREQSKSNAAQAAANAIVGPKRGKGEAKVHEQRWAAAAQAASDQPAGSLVEIELTTPIRYAPGDYVEKWLNKLLCLESTAGSLKLSGGAPAPDHCELYSVDRDALFSYHKLSEAFLQKIMGLYTSAHYKNTPNDLQLLSDAPAHALFVLLSPNAEKDSDSLPDVLAVIQVAMEGQISRKAVEAQLARGHRSAGDLIPWTLAQQFGDSKFAQLSGARIVRIATHPSVQGMGYGTHAMNLLYRFYNGEMISLANHVEDDSEDGGDDASMDEDESDDETGAVETSGLQQERLKPRKEIPPLLLPLTEIDAPRLDWIGTSFGLTLQLHKFWTRAGMRLLYLRQTQNELTGEHSAIMVRTLSKRTGFDDSWLDAFSSDTRRRMISLLGGSFRDIEVRLALSLLENFGRTQGTKKSIQERAGAFGGKISIQELDLLLTPHDLKRLELYGRNLCDHHLVTDLLPTLARLYFSERFGSDFALSGVQAALLCGTGLQAKSVEQLSNELGLPVNQALAMFNKAIRKLSITLNGIALEQEKEDILKKQEVAAGTTERLRDVARQTLEEDLSDGADEALDALNASNNLPPEISQDPELMQYAIKGSTKQWEKALDGKDVKDGTVVIQSVREKRKISDDDVEKEASKDKLLKDKGKKKDSGNKNKKKNKRAKN
jgi:N-acetyltransferase 10